MITAWSHAHPDFTVTQLIRSIVTVYLPLN